MSPLPTSPLLADILRTVPRRYRLPAFPAEPSAMQQADAATRVAVAIEQAREAFARGEPPGEAPKRLFVQALAQLIGEAMRPDGGDAALQAMVLRHRAAPVSEYAALGEHAGQDRRAVHGVVDAIGHRVGQHGMPPGTDPERLRGLLACASSSSWSALYDTARDLLAMPQIAGASSIGPDLARLLDSPALERLRRMERLSSAPLVIEYLRLRERHGARPGSQTAAAWGLAARQRGAAVEALAADALRALARRIDAAEDGVASYRVATAMRVPASIPGHDRAKTEWDAVLLRRADTAGRTEIGEAWDVCLLVEAKASVEAASTDLPRLLRGVRLLSQADEDAVYAFETAQGTVRVRGASLRALPVDETALASTVLYCSDAPAEAAPRLFNAASRMRLLSTQASLDFASALAQGQYRDIGVLEPVWQQLLESPQWRAVLHQYPTLRRVREWMVNTQDLLAAIDGAGE
ncbi:hypothetical protein L602_001100000030 [Cupriavidus gilardii J11]|uniref:3-deoxy-D-arabino-heptulosonate 7-phosphate synthase n=1 Tax=Cupriavidus gilardii J11 TaxID=936133 RepID=A0A562BTK2_9BURK|nr:3-deoxy-D-arabino-heptulosonate 7-phosphate synthase [Cupriavidus gilardii]TWG88571.1 hypothetical protein L602_001100000030 [Cupriavidus gilardii J11]